MNKYHLIVDNNVKDNVKLIFNLIAKGYSIRKVQDILKSKKIQTPYGYSMNINKYNWCYRTIEEMIKNETYIGNITQGKRKKINYKSKKEIRIPKEDWIIVKNTHEAIIDYKIFKKANDKLKRK